MKPSSIIIGAAVVLVAIVATSKLWLTRHDDLSYTENETTSVSNKVTTATTVSTLVSKDQTSITGTNNTLALTPPQSNKAEASSVDEALFNVEENPILQEAFQQVASQYADNISFPTNSQPVRNIDDVRGFKPFEQSRVDTPFPAGEEDEDPIRIAAATDTFQYFTGDTISVRVEIINAPDDAFIAVEGTLSGSNGEVAIDNDFASSDQNNNIFTTQINTKQVDNTRLSSEMVVKLNVVVGNRDLSTTVPLRYSAAAAQIVDVQRARPEGPELIIPLSLDVFEEGYYFISGVLVDANSNRPLIQLQAESRLLTGRASIDFKAHISALQAQQSEGPYLLQNLNAYRGAEVGESLDTPASVVQRPFRVDGFPFSDYEDEAFVDELAQERLEFLNNFTTNSGVTTQ